MIQLSEKEEFLLAMKEAEIDCFSYLEKARLYEKVYDILDEDLEMIYAPLRRYINDLSNIQNAEEVKKVFYTELLEVFSSEDLVSPICKQAHEIKKVTIQVYDSCQNYYNSKGSKIAIGFTSLSEKITEQWYNCFPQIQQRSTFFPVILSIILESFNLSPTDEAYIKSLFTERFMKTTIYHELSHWLSDTLHNNHLTKGVDQAIKKKGSVSQHYKTSDMIFSKIEMDAYINGLAYLKKLIGQKEWDIYKFNTIFSIYPALQTIIHDSNKNAIVMFKKNLYKRMHREGLLGKNMLNQTPSPA